MKHETAQAKAKEIAERTLAPNARQNDKEGLLIPVHACVDVAFSRQP